MTTQQLPDLRPLLLQAFDAADGLVLAVGEDDLTRPTPCDEFDVRALLDHLTMVVQRVRIVLEGGPFTDAAASTAVDAAGLQRDWSADLASLRAALPTVDLGATITAPFGTAPAAVAVGMYCGEVTVHSWDLAVALDRTDLLDPALGEALVESARRGIPEEREGIPFAPVVAVPDDAPGYDRLLGWYGRDPGWQRP